MSPKIAPIDRVLLPVPAFFIGMELIESGSGNEYVLGIGTSVALMLAVLWITDQMRGNQTGTERETEPNDEPDGSGPPAAD